MIRAKIILGALVATLWMGQAQAATITLNLTGSATPSSLNTVVAGGHQFDFFNFALTGMDLPATVSQGDVVNNNVSFDGAVSVPTAPVWTSFLQYYFGNAFPDIDTAVDDGTLTFYSGTDVVNTYNYGTSTRGQLAAGGAAFAPNNTAFSFDSFTNNFTITNLAQTVTLDQSQFSYILVSNVPEPATWAMLLMGFFGVGFVVRGARRKDSVAIA